MQSTVVTERPLLAPPKGGWGYHRLFCMLCNSLMLCVTRCMLPKAYCQYPATCGMLDLATAVAGTWSLEGSGSHRQVVLEAAEGAQDQHRSNGNAQQQAALLRRSVMLNVTDGLLPYNPADDKELQAHTTLRQVETGWPSSTCNDAKIIIQGGVGLP